MIKSFFVFYNNDKDKNKLKEIIEEINSNEKYKFLLDVGLAHSLKTLILEPQGSDLWTDKSVYAISSSNEEISLNKSFGGITSFLQYIKNMNFNSFTMQDDKNVMNFIIRRNKKMDFTNKTSMRVNPECTNSKYQRIKNRSY